MFAESPGALKMRQLPQLVLIILDIKVGTLLYVFLQYLIFLAERL